VNTGDFNRISCSHCKTENFLSHKFCKICGKELNDTDEKTRSNQIVSFFACPSCKRLAPRDGKFCPHCDVQITPPKQKEGCFIATACFEIYDAPEVIVLRKYRDEVLNQTYIGRILISMYYKISPPIARIISQSDYLKIIIRKNFLQPLISMIEKKSSKHKI
jgi:hypothetical protein